MQQSNALISNLRLQAINSLTIIIIGLINIHDVFDYNATRLKVILSIESEMY